MIGCVLLRDLFFMPPQAALPQSEDFASNLTSAKGYAIAWHMDTVFLAD